MADDKARFIGAGDSVPHTPSSDVASGDVILLGDTVAVAKTPIAANTLGHPVINGEFEFPVAGPTVLAQGATAHWDPDGAGASGLVVAASGTGTTELGRVTVASGVDETRVRVRINFG